jgi:ketosteroid isomerase-like protein
VPESPIVAQPRSRPCRAFDPRRVRRGAEAANRRDFEVLLLSFDPAIEYEVAESLAGRFVFPDLLGVQRGHAGYRRMWQGFIEAFQDLKLEPEEVIDSGGRALVAGRVIGHGSQSGVGIDEPLFQVFTMRRGLVIRQKDFADREEALEVVELRG